MNRQRISVLLFFMFIAVAVTIFGQSDGTKHSADWYESEAKRAIEAENYESAIKIITEAKRYYPGVVKFNLMLGNLYYDKGLFRLALEEYRKAENKGDDSYYTLNQISRSLGKLNKNRESIEYLKKIITIYPDSVEAYDDLGWMYFKTHQLRLGKKILLDAIDRFGENRAFAMTLGTIYSGLYDYQNAKKYYVKAIKDALKLKDNYFASIAYYNLSLLEHNFYHFNSALKYTNESIRKADRAPGHLSRGELFEAQLDFRNALAEYTKALSRDTTPLSKVNLAILYQKFGNLKLAIKYIEDVFHSKDLSWMFYYGTDLERHYKDIYEILADSYEGLSHYEKLLPSSGILDRLKKCYFSVKYAVMGYYYRAKFRIYSVRVGEAYLNEKDYLDAYWEFYRANEKYRNIALKYLFLARDIEVKITPHSKAYYLQEEGKIRKSAALLKESVSLFDPFWEREAIVESLRRMVPMLRGKERRTAINSLYRLNRGALLQYGLGLPLQLGVAVGQSESSQYNNEEPSGRIVRLVKRMLKHAGSEVSYNGEKGDERESFDFRIYFAFSKGTKGNLSSAVVRLIDESKGRVVWENRYELRKGTFKRKIADLLLRVIDKIYKAE